MPFRMLASTENQQAGLAAHKLFDEEQVPIAFGNIALPTPALRRIYKRLCRETAVGLWKNV